jgi:tRNA/tmRNA/rRNA uracil-C5-methylase (TrmA/RlmC/RlmD family)
MVVAENVTGTERILHLEPRDGRVVDAERLMHHDVPGVTGVTLREEAGVRLVRGRDRIRDTAEALFGESRPEHVSADVVWERGAASFFQGNRFLAGRLAAYVLSHLDGSHVGDAYAGIGFFAVAAAAAGRQVLAIEGDGDSARDLAFNARAWPGLHAEHGAVEHVLPRVKPGLIDVLVVDPPRSGMSSVATDAVLAMAPPRIVYVSCDVATLARDARCLVEAGYRLGPLAAFDLFPNTAHIETVAVFDRA